MPLPETLSVADVHAVVVHAHDTTYGMAAVPAHSDLVWVLRRRHDTWYGVNTVDASAGAAALIGEPIPVLRDALDAALAANPRPPLS